MAGSRLCDRGKRFEFVGLGSVFASGSVARFLRLRFFGFRLELTSVSGVQLCWRERALPETETGRILSYPVGGRGRLGI